MIEVDTSSVGIVEFDASQQKRQGLVANGRDAAERFVQRWNWAEYLAECRGFRGDG